MPKQDIIPKTETVQEIKNKNEFPSYEEFLKNYEADEGIVSSYNDEIEGYKDIRVGKISGPMAYGREVLRDFPIIVELFDYNRGGTINFLKEKGALQTYETAHNLRFYCTSTSNSDYRHEIEMYLDQLTRQFLG